MKKNTIFGITAAAGLSLALAAPAAAQSGSSEQDRDRTTVERSTDDDRGAGEQMSDAWIHTKVKTQFVGEDALEGSDIDVDVKNGVVTLKGTVASAAGKERAKEIARKTDGVVRVDDRLTIGMARDADDRDAAVGTSGTAASGTPEGERTTAREAYEESREVGREAREEAGEAQDDAREQAREAREEAREETREARDEAQERARDARDEAHDEGRGAVGTAGAAVSDGWITTKVKTSFVGEDALANSDIDVDTKNGVVTLKGNVASQAGKVRAEAIAKDIDGVKQVKNQLKVKTSNDRTNNQ